LIEHGATSSSSSKYLEHILLLDISLPFEPDPEFWFFCSFIGIHNLVGSRSAIHQSFLKTLWLQRNISKEVFM